VCRIVGDYTSVAFAPDGRSLVTGRFRDGSILLCDLKELFRGKPSGAERQVKDSVSLWKELASSDVPRAYRAIGQLMGEENVAVALLAKHLRPVLVPKDESVEALVKDLESPEYAEREKARQQLEEMREGARSVLERVKKAPVPLETRLRVEDILRRLQPWSSDRLREMHGVQILEYLGTPAAERLLRSLAKGMPEARLTQEVKASLKRLERVLRHHELPRS
jgi:hypothetical protein